MNIANVQNLRPETDDEPEKEESEDGAEEDKGSETASSKTHCLYPSQRKANGLTATVRWPPLSGACLVGLPR